METIEVLTIAAELGRGLLVNGAEIYRVENSVRLILEAYGHKTETINVFVITNVVIVTISPEGSVPVTKTLRVLSRSTNLSKVAEFNALSRHLCKELPGYEEANERLQTIMEEHSYSLLLQTLAYAAGAGFFAMFFKGSLMDGLVAAVIGILIRLFQHILSKNQVNPLFSNILCSGMATVIAFYAVKFGISGNMDKVIIGALMTLVPGMLTTNCARDLIVGDIVAGLSRFAEAILIAVSIAVGTVVTMSILV